MICASPQAGIQISPTPSHLLQVISRHVTELPLLAMVWPEGYTTQGVSAMPPSPHMLHSSSIFLYIWAMRYTFYVEEATCYLEQTLSLTKSTVH
jgi:hypothetical protein